MYHNSVSTVRNCYCHFQYNITTSTNQARTVVVLIENECRVEGVMQGQVDVGCQHAEVEAKVEGREEHKWTPSTA